MSCADGSGPRLVQTEVNSFVVFALSKVSLAGEARGDLNYFSSHAHGRLLKSYMRRRNTAAGIHSFRLQGKALKR